MENRLQGLRSVRRVFYSTIARRVEVYLEEHYERLRQASEKFRRKSEKAFLTAIQKWHLMHPQRSGSSVRKSNLLRQKISFRSVLLQPRIIQFELIRNLAD